MVVDRVPERGTPLLAYGPAVRARRAILCASVVALGFTSCAEGEEPPARRTAEPSASASPAVAVPSGAVTACELVTVEDALAVLGGEVDTVADPVGAELVAEIPADGTACAYRPVPDDGRSVTALVFPEASIDLGSVVARGLSLGGRGFERWEVDGTVVVRKADSVLTITVISVPDDVPDRTAGLALSDVAAERMPAAEPDPDNEACSLLAATVDATTFGVEVVYAGGEILDASSSGCGYRAPGEPFEVQLRLTRGAEAAAQFESARSDAEGEDGFEPLEGLGDDAFVTSGVADVNVVVLAGDGVFRLSTITPDGEILDATIALAGEVVSAL